MAFLSRVLRLLPNRISPTLYVLLIWLFALFSIGAQFLNAERMAGLDVLDTSETADRIYLLSAIVGSAAALLTSAVLTLAPLLSLALHQSYDGIFSVLRELLSLENNLGGADAKKAALHLRRTNAIYNHLDPWFYSIWLSSCILLLVAGVRPFLSSWDDRRLYFEAMAFFGLSCVNAVSFALLAIVYFISTRPGLTKLEIILSYLQHKNVLEATEMPTPPKITPLKVTFVLLIVLGLLTAVGLAIFWRPRPTEVPTARVAINSLAIASAPVFVLTGSTAKLTPPLTIQTLSFTSGRLALDALLGGDVDAATVAETPVVVASRNRPDLRIIATLTLSQFRIIARRSAGIALPADLKGKRIAALLGTSSEFFLVRFAERNGIPTEFLSPMNLQPPDMITALSKGDIDAISIWEPHAWRATQVLGSDAISFSDPESYREHFNLVTTQARLQDPKSREALRRLVINITSANKSISADPLVSQKLVADRLGLGLSDLLNIWNVFSFPGGIPTDTLLKTMQEVERWDANRSKNPVRKASSLATLVDSSLFPKESHP